MIKELNRVKTFQQIFVLLAACWLVACGGSTDFPVLKQGEGLRADCAILLEKYPEGDIPTGAWPHSIKELKATRVQREKLNIRIYVPEKKRGDFKSGYCVFLDPQLAPPTRGVWIQKTEFKGIYQFRHY